MHNHSVEWPPSFCAPKLIKPSEQKAICQEAKRNLNPPPLQRIMIIGWQYIMSSCHQGNGWHGISYISESLGKRVKRRVLAAPNPILVLKMDKIGLYLF